MTEKTTIRIDPNAKVEIWRDGEWTILYVEDGSGSKTTVSLGAITGQELTMFTAEDKAALRRGIPLERRAADEIDRLQGHKDEADRHIATIAQLRHEIVQLRAMLREREKVE